MPRSDGGAPGPGRPLVDTDDGIGERPIHVLHLLSTARPEGTGIARLVAALAQRLDPARYRVHAWFLGDEGPLLGELGAAGVPARAAPWRGASDPLGAYRLWLALAGERVDLVHQHAAGRTVQRLVRLATRAPVVAHLHSAVSEGGGPSPARALARSAAAAVATSAYVAERAHAETGVQAQVIYPGVEAPLATHRAAGAEAPPVIGAAGRLVPLKGFEHLVRALPLLADVRVRLEIAGSGPEEPGLRALAAALGVQERVRFLGWRADLPALFPGWSLFIAPSLEEGFGIAALEAMAAGLPVVSTHVGGLPELVEHGVTGRLVPPADPASLAAAIDAALADHEWRRAAGLAAARRVRERFSVERLAADVAQLYDRLIGGSGGERPAGS